MYCENCGKKLTESQKFCPICGTKKYTAAEEIVKTKPKKVKQAKCWRIFANIGFGLGLGGFISSWFVIGYIISIYGIVFSILGMHSNTNHGKAVSGLILSIMGVIIGLLIYFLLLANA